MEDIYPVVVLSKLTRLNIIFLYRLLTDPDGKPT